MTTERRGSHRHKTFKGGSISFDLAPPVACIIRNMSESGAGLELSNPAQVPDSFDLLIKPELLKRHCRVVWRADNRLGVQFV